MQLLFCGDPRRNSTCCCYGYYLMNLLASWYRSLPYRSSSFLMLCYNFRPVSLPFWYCFEIGKIVMFRYVTTDKDFTPSKDFGWGLLRDFSFRFWGGCCGCCCCFCNEISMSSILWQQIDSVLVLSDVLSLQDQRLTSQQTNKKSKNPLDRMGSLRTGTGVVMC